MVKHWVTFCQFPLVCIKWSQLIYYLFWVKMLSQQSTSQKRSWQDTENRLFSPFHQTTLPVIPLAVGPPSLHWLSYGLVVLRPLHCCLLPHALSFLSPRVSVTPHIFITNLFLIHKLKRRPTIKWIKLIWA